MDRFRTSDGVDGGEHGGDVCVTEEEGGGDLAKGDVNMSRYIHATQLK